MIFGGISHMYVYNDSSWTTNGYLMMTYNTSGLGGNNSVGASIFITKDQQIHYIVEKGLLHGLVIVIHL